MEEPPLVSLNTMSVRQTFWGRTRKPPARSSLLMVERPPAIKFDNRAKVPLGMVIGRRSAPAAIHLKSLIKWHKGTASSELFQAKNYRNPLGYPRLSEASLVLFGELARLAHVVGASRYGKKRSRIVASDCGSKRGASDAAHEGCRGYYRVSDRQQNTIRFWTLWSRQCRHS